MDLELIDSDSPTEVRTFEKVDSSSTAWGR
jgi:hypothetical protein